MATLDDSDMKRALDSAVADREASQAAIADYQVQLKYAEIELRRTQELQKPGVSDPRTRLMLHTIVDSLKAKIALAKEPGGCFGNPHRQAQQYVDNCTIRPRFTASWFQRTRSWVRWFRRFPLAADSREPASPPSLT